MMKVTEQINGGLLFHIDTPTGLLIETVDADGNIIQGQRTCEVRDPSTPQPPTEKKQGCGGCKKLSIAEKVAGLIKLNKAFNDYIDVSDKILQHRKAICQQCEHNDIGRCEPCGCIIWAKIRFGGEACPNQLWAAVDKE